jgi:hypothetical protein
MAILPRNQMENIEHAARVLLVARRLGRVNRLTRIRVEALDDERNFLV